jgi:CRP-like cAMP-binding protein
MSEGRGLDVGSFDRLTVQVAMIDTPSSFPYTPSINEHVPFNHTKKGQGYNMYWSLYLTGFFWGTASAISLPLGALIGLWTRPSSKITSALMAFGAGALLFALTTELFGHALHVARDHHGAIIDPWIIVVMIIAAAAGGLLFQVLNQILNNQGAFLRKGALIKKHIGKEKRRQARKLFRGLSRIKILQGLPAEEAIRLIPHMKKTTFRQGEVIFKEGDPGDRLYFILSGKVSVIRAPGAKQIATLGPGDIFGEIALFVNQTRNATVVTETAAKVWELPKRDFDYLLDRYPALQKAFRRIVRERIHDLSQKEAVPEEEARIWEQEALKSFSRVPVDLTDEEIQDAVEEHDGKGGAALSIWLGIALDGIPESLVIGMLVIAAATGKTSMSLAFIVGVFLANLPEAMSSAVTMRTHGAGIRKIFWLWMSLCLMTGTGAFCGAVIFPPHPEGWLVYFIFGIEGIAAGAMLTMISETMLPEAFEQGGGTIVGLSTLTGFLVALAVKLIH